MGLRRRRIAPDSGGNGWQDRCLWAFKNPGMLEEPKARVMINRFRHRASTSFLILTPSGRSARVSPAAKNGDELCHVPGQLDSPGLCLCCGRRHDLAQSEKTTCRRQLRTSFTPLPGLPAFLPTSSLSGLNWIWKRGAPKQVAAPLIKRT